MSCGSYGNSTLFLKRSQYISIDFYVLRKTQKALNTKRLLRAQLGYIEKIELKDIQQIQNFAVHGTGISWQVQVV